MHASNIGALTATGRREMRLLATSVYTRYGSLLLKNRPTPRPQQSPTTFAAHQLHIAVTSTNKPRVIESATEFLTAMDSLCSSVPKGKNKIDLVYHKTEKGVVASKVDLPIAVLADQRGNFLRYYRGHSNHQYAKYTSSHRKNAAKLLTNTQSGTNAEHEDYYDRILSFLRPERIQSSHSTIAEACFSVTARLHEEARLSGIDVAIQDCVPPRAVRGLAEAIASHHALSPDDIPLSTKEEIDEIGNQLCWTQLLTREQIKKFELIEDCIRPFAAAHQIFPSTVALLLAHMSERLRNASFALSAIGKNRNISASELSHIDANFGHAETIAPLLLSLGVPACTPLSSIVPYGANFSVELFARTCSANASASSDNVGNVHKFQNLNRDKADDPFVLRFLVNERAFVPPIFANVSQKCLCGITILNEKGSGNKFCDSSSVSDTDTNATGLASESVDNEGNRCLVDVVPLNDFLEFADSVVAEHSRSVKEPGQ